MSRPPSPPDNSKLQGLVHYLTSQPEFTQLRISWQGPNRLLLHAPGIGGHSLLAELIDWLLHKQHYSVSRNGANGIFVSETANSQVPY